MIGGLALIALLGAPLFAVLAALALILYARGGLDPSGIVIEMYRMARAPTLSAIPLFTFAGYVLAASKAPQRYVDFARALLGWIPGGVAVAALAASAFFTALTGASGVTIIALGGILLPVLIADRYPERFGYGLLATSGSIGMLFPPSLPLLLYGLVAEVDVNRLFLAGAVPGAMLMLLFAGYAAFRAQTAGVAREPFDLSRLFRSAKAAAWELPLPFVVLGGIYGGVFTATEAAGVTAAYALLLTAAIRREVSLVRDLPALCRRSMVLVGAILLLLAAAMGLTSWMVDEMIPARLLEAMKGWFDGPIGFLLALNLFLLLAGTVMDVFSAIVVLTPLVVPVAREFGVDPLHLGVVFLVNLEIGYCHPPLGLNLFLASMRFRRPLWQLTLDSIPFLLLLLIGLGLVSYVPTLSLWLPRTFGP